MNALEIESLLQAQIDPWLEHMRWRPDYDEWRTKRIWQENYQADALADLVKYAGEPNGTKRLLDLGAGMGGFAVAVTRKGWPVIALDYSFSYCEITRTRGKRYGLDIAMLEGAGEALPFGNASFDVVTCWDVLEHVQDPARLLGEIVRVLKPGGYAFVTVINRLALVDPHYHLRFINWMPRSLAERYIEWRQRTKQTPLRDRQRLSEMHYYTFGAIIRLLARLGLQAQDLNESRSRFRVLPRPFGTLLYRLWRTWGTGTFRLAVTKNS